MTVAYIAIGNSDDKLTQAEWAAYYGTVNLAINRAAQLPGYHVYGRWLSVPSDPWQNACWALELAADRASVEHLKMRLVEIAADFRQDSVAWAEAPTTEFLGPAGMSTPSTSRNARTGGDRGQRCDVAS